MDLNLDTLKQDMLGHLEHSEFAVFRSEAGGLDELPTVLWDVERYPDYQMFLDAARKSGAKMILFASREFSKGELDEMKEQLEDIDMPRDEKRDVERALQDLRVHDGTTCEIELGFAHQSWMYVYSAQPDWYVTFQDLSDEILGHLPLDDEPDGGNMGGFYSNN